MSWFLSHCLTNPSHHITTKRFRDSRRTAFIIWSTLRKAELFIAAVVKLMALLPRTPPTLPAQGEWTAGKQTPSIITIVTLFTEFIISPVKKKKKKAAVHLWAAKTI